MRNIQNVLLTEKYRPKTLDDLITPARVKSKLEKGVYQHLLLHGSPGTGKTSAAKALVKHFKHPYLYINASTDTSVDVVRNRITDFCANRSIMDEPGKMKVIILDEIDGVSDQFFKALLDSQSSRTSRYYSLHSKLSEWCKQIGELSMQLIKELKEEKNLKTYQSSDFRQTATKKLEEINQEIAREMNQI